MWTWPAFNDVRLTQTSGDQEYITDKTLGVTSLVSVPADYLVSFILNTLINAAFISSWTHLKLVLTSPIKYLTPEAHAINMNITPIDIAVAVYYKMTEKLQYVSP